MVVGGAGRTEVQGPRPGIPGLVDFVAPPGSGVGPKMRGSVYGTMLPASEWGRAGVQDLDKRQGAGKGESARSGGDVGCRSRLGLQGLGGRRVHEGE